MQIKSLEFFEKFQESEKYSENSIEKKNEKDSESSFEKKKINIKKVSP